ncbi:hypothetical protein [Paracoccus pacificus]|uniref:Uncharacterized protein n=1 Tax=Paracoccus pacificus TaxID=1463598 RepID=A0ABW4RCF0_9RHOB
MAGDVHAMADDVAGLIVSRLGGARRGEPVDLQTMLRRRGGALPGKLRREALVLAQADKLSESPRIARQLDMERLDKAHAALVSHLQPLGAASRFTGGLTNVIASVMFGLLILAAVVIWVMVRRGQL